MTASRTTWMLMPLGIFAVTRLVDAMLLLHAAQRQTMFWRADGVPTSQRPQGAAALYWSIVCNWDGKWYRSIAETGYPRHLPVVAGHVAENEWAFYPAYPAIVRLVMAATGWDFPLAASATSLVCAAVAVTLLYRMLMHTADAFVATTTVVALCTFASAPVLQVAYTESLALLLVILALWALSAHRYATFAAIALVLAVTRAIVLPLAAVVAVHWVVRWRRSGEEHFPARDQVTLGLLTVFTAVLAGLWPGIAGLVTGDRGAFFETQAAWIEPEQRSHWPSWFSLALHASPPAATVLVATAIAVVALLALRRPARNWGHALRAWVLFCPLYLAISTRATTSILRYLMLGVAPAWPLPDGRPVVTQMRWATVLAVAAFGLLCQYFWVREAFVLRGTQGFPP